MKLPTSLLAQYDRTAITERESAAKKKKQSQLMYNRRRIASAIKPLLKNKVIRYADVVAIQDKHNIKVI